MISTYIVPHIFENVNQFRKFTFLTNASQSRTSGIMFICGNSLKIFFENAQKHLAKRKRIWYN